MAGRNLPPGVSGQEDHFEDDIIIAGDGGEIVDERQATAVALTDALDAHTGGPVTATVDVSAPVLAAARNHADRTGETVVGVLMEYAGVEVDVRATATEGDR